MRGVISANPTHVKILTFRWGTTRHLSELLQPRKFPTKIPAPQQLAPRYQTRLQLFDRLSELYQSQKQGLVDLVNQDQTPQTLSAEIQYRWR